MMSGSGSEFADLLHCMICFESFTNPKMLKCGHTFCADCLQGYLTTYQQQKKSQVGKLPCPTCREMTTLPSGGVQALRTDFKVKRIEEMFKTVNMRDSRGPRGRYQCDACRAQKRVTRAPHYCTSCTMSYCDDCLAKHRKNPLFTNHAIIDREADTTGEAFCRSHSGEQVRYFCRDCEAVICTVCVMNGHETHNVIEIDAVYKQHRKDIRKLQRTVEGKLEQLRDKAVRLGQLRDVNLVAYQNAELAVKTRAREVKELVRQQEMEMLEELSKARDEKLKELKRQKDTADYDIAHACSLQDYAQLTSSKNSLRAMAVHEELIQRMRTVSEMESVLDNATSSVPTFLVSRSDFKLGSIRQIAGDVKDLSKSHGSPPKVAAAPPSGDPVAVTLRPDGRAKLLYAVTRCGSSKGELRDPLGVVCLATGTAVVAEWGNKRLQLFDNVGKSVLTIGDGHVGPQGLALTAKGNVIITDARNKRLEVFGVEGQSISKWGLGKFFAPCGVAVSKNGNCIVTDIHEHTVSIYQGEKACIKRWGFRGSKDEQFHNPLYVATDKENNIYVSDSDNHCVKVFDPAGKYKRKFGRSGDADGCLSYPRGICLNQDGNVVIADRNNDRVSLWTTQGRFLRHLVLAHDGLRNPYAVAMTPARNLLVTESGTDRAALKMFQL